MKREEKNQQTQRRIMDSALAEFAEKGHGGSSVNTICAAQGISKGIIYHYFENKDELYLACVEECFQRLTAHLSAALPEEDDGSVEDQLGRYFTARMTFFQENPVYQPIFCEAVISPPARLFEQIQARRKAFDALTISTLKHLLRCVRTLPWRKWWTYSGSFRTLSMRRRKHLPCLPGSALLFGMPSAAGC